MAERKNILVELMSELENYSSMYLSKGRKDWDVPHTKAVVYHATNIALSEKLDSLVLGTTAWLHDIGYYDLFRGDSSKQYDGVQDKKAMHMINGAMMAGEFLALPDIKDYYTPAQIERIVHLISVHDKLEELNAIDEIAFMEADTLGAIDTSRVRSTFNKEDALKYITKDLLPRRFKRFQTKTGIDMFNQIFKRYLEQYDLTPEDVTGTSN